MILLADLIDKRYNEVRLRIENHLKVDSFEINLNDIYAYWGKYYLYSDELFSFNVTTWDVDEKFEKGISRIRDVHHYQSMLKSDIDFEKMIVANTGFSKHIKNELKGLPIEIVCASSRQTELFE
jgi:hypothetical protein